MPLKSCHTKILSVPAATAILGHTRTLTQVAFSHSELLVYQSINFHDFAVTSHLC